MDPLVFKTDKIYIEFIFNSLISPRVFPLSICRTYVILFFAAVYYFSTRGTRKYRDAQILLFSRIHPAVTIAIVTFAKNTSTCAVRWFSFILFVVRKQEFLLQGKRPWIKI